MSDWRRVSGVVASGVGGFAKANILISVGLRSAPPNLRLMHYFSCVVPVGWVKASETQH